MITQSRSYVSPYAPEAEALPTTEVVAVAYSAAVRYSADAEHPAAVHNPDVAEAPEVDVVTEQILVEQVVVEQVAVEPVAIEESVISSTATEIVAAVPAGQLEQQVYEIVRARVLESIGHGANWTVAFRSSSDTDTFFSDTMAEMIAKDVASRLVATTFPAPAA